MKRSLAVLMAVFIIAGIVYAKGADTVTIKPKFKKNDPYKIENEFILHLEKGEDKFDQSFIWKYELTPTKVKSGFIDKAKVKTTAMESYVKGIYKGDVTLDTPKETSEFSVENNLLKNFIREVPDKKTPKVIYRFILAITYVYLTKEKIEVGKGAEIPEEVIKDLQSMLGLEFKDELKYKIRVKEEIEKDKPVFGIEKGCVLETALSWRNGDEGIECRAIAVYDDKKDLIAGIKAHGWIKHKTLNTENVCFTFDLKMNMDPPGNFEHSEYPKPAKYPDAPKNDAGDTPSGDVPTPFKVGEAAPAFTLEDLNGKKVSLSDFKGKVVLMHMWTTSFGEAAERMEKHFKPIYESYSKDKFVMISLGIPYKEDTIEKQKKVINDKGIEWVTLWDKDRSVHTKYQLNSIYDVVLIDKDGKVVNSGSLTDKTKGAEIGKYLKEHCSK